MHLWPLFRGISLAVMVALPADASVQCTALGSVYRLSTDTTDSDVTMEFRASASPSAHSDLELILNLPDRLAPFVFQPTQSQGFGTIFAVATDPGLEDADLPVAFFNALPGGRLVPYSLEVPQSRWKAPDAIYVTGLASALWYATNGSKKPISLPQEMWYRIPCD